MVTKMVRWANVLVVVVVHVVVVVVVVLLLKLMVMLALLSAPPVRVVECIALRARSVYASSVLLVVKKNT